MNNTDIPNDLRKRILDSIDAATNSSLRIGVEAISIDGVVMLSANDLSRQLERLMELKELVAPKSIP